MPPAPVVAARARWPREPEAPITGAAAASADVAAREPFGLPFHLLCVLTFVVIGRPNDYFLFLVPLRLALVFTILTVVVTLLRSSKDSTTSFSPFAIKETKLYMVLYAAMVFGIPFAIYRPGAFDHVIMRYVVNVVFFLLFLMHVDSVAKFKRMAAVLVLSVAMYNAFGFISGGFMGGRYVTGSRMFDPNDVAFIEVSLLGFALWVLVSRFGLLMKAIALATVLSGVLLTLFTASRGGLLGLTTFLLLFLGLRVSNVSKFFKVVLVAILIGGAYWNADKINFERYQTLGSLENDYNLAEGGRVETWERGITLFWQDPLTGVGVGGFGKAVGEQRRDEGVLPKWQTAHSAYVQVLTETGIVGATAFLLLIVTSVRTFNRLRRAPAQVLPDRELAVLPGILLVGFGAQLVAAIFLSQAYSMFFTLAFAMSAALNRMTAAAAAVPHPAPAPEAAPAVPRWTPRPRASTRG